MTLHEPGTHEAKLGTAEHRVTALEQAHALAEPLIRSSLARLDAHIGHVCGYHLGYWDAEGNPGSGSGKGVRPALALLSARAAGAPTEVGVPAAAACELVHNFSLLHDDVMDGDEERRHRPTVWARFGTPTAILAGDALLALANEVLSESSAATVPWAVRCLNATTRRLVAGQSADLAFESTDDVSLQQCLKMADDKTGALLACATSLGAVLAEAPAALALSLAEYGRRVGLAFQLTDDLLGIWGSPQRTGKPVWSDLRARKKSLPVVAALQSRTAAGQELRALYGRPEPLDEAQLETCAALVESSGGRHWAAQRAREESAQALAVLESLTLDPDVRADLVALTEMLSLREH